MHFERDASFFWSLILQIPFHWNRKRDGLEINTCRNLTGCRDQVSRECCTEIAVSRHISVFSLFA